MNKLVVAFLVGLVCVVYGGTWVDKVDERLRAKFETADTMEYIIMLEQKQLSSDTVEPKDRPAYVYNELSMHATRTQAPLIEFLTQAKLPYKAYWVVNIVVTTSNLTLLTELATRDEVVFIEPNTPFYVDLEKPEEIFETNGTETEKRQAPVIEWNLGFVNCDHVWENGNRGTGFVVANADTGVQWDHPALINAYRGYNGGAANHNYNWWDAIHQTGSSCGASSRVPCDDNGHGTHTTGTAVGFDPATNHYYGVAPAAKWIGCRNMNSNVGTPTTYIECFQFFVAPTDLNGDNPRPDLAPHVIGNSWGCPPSEGCNSNSLEQSIGNVIAAGIFMSVSAGNSGSSCNSIRDPPGNSPQVCSVGATDFNTRNIAFYSSRGPIGTRIAPTLVAPGSRVTSSYPPNRYASLSGTSMASPAVTGAIPLIWLARPDLHRKPDETRTHMGATASVISSTLCGSPSGSPNNVYGFGLLDTLKATTPTN